MPTFEFPKFDLPKFDLPKIDMPKIDMPKVEFADVDLPSADEVIDFVRDATLVGTGFVAMTAERIADFQKQLVDVITTQAAKFSS